MIKFRVRTLASVVAFSAIAFVSTAALAAVHPLGNLDPDNAGSYNETDPTGGIDAEGTFTLTTNALAALSATIAVGSSAAYTPGVLELWEGATLIESVALTFANSAYTASFSKLLAPGSYTEEITGTVNVAKLGIGGTVTTSAVPEPSTWAMLVLGFAGLGYAAFRRNAKGQVQSVGI
jgi:hypothetical protein